MKFLFLMVCIVMVLGAAVGQVQLFKVAHEASPHATALRIVDESGATWHFWDDEIDLFAPPRATHSLCTAAGCCSPDAAYRAPEERAALIALEHNYRHGIDRWMLYYYLCGGPHRALAAEADTHAAHQAIDAVMLNSANLRAFLSWIRSVSVQ